MNELVFNTQQGHLTGSTLFTQSRFPTSSASRASLAKAAAGLRAVQSGYATVQIYPNKTAAAPRRGDIAALCLPSGQPSAGYLRFASVPVARQARPRGGEENDDGSNRS